MELQDNWTLLNVTFDYVDYSDMTLERPTSNVPDITSEASG